MKAEIEGLKEWEAWIDTLPDGVEQEAMKLVEKTAYKIEADAKRNTPVDTGRLRASIDTDLEPKKIQAEVGTDVEYSDIVELGSSKQRPQPYLFPAFDKNTQTFESEFRNIFDKGLS